MGLDGSNRHSTYFFQYKNYKPSTCKVLSVFLLLLRWINACVFYVTKCVFLPEKCAIIRLSATSLGELTCTQHSPGPLPGLMLHGARMGKWEWKGLEEKEMGGEGRLRERMNPVAKSCLLCCTVVCKTLGRPAKYALSTDQVYMY